MHARTDSQIFAHQHSRMHNALHKHVLIELHLHYEIRLYMYTVDRACTCTLFSIVKIIIFGIIVDHKYKYKYCSTPLVSRPCPFAQCKMIVVIIMIVQMIIFGIIVDHK